MVETREPVDKTRQRALFSCDRCKRRKRACKRYNDVGVRVFDNITPCDKCKTTSSICETTIMRKKRNLFSVSESSLLQLKCLTKIFKAMFPEFNPNSFEDIDHIARLLYVELPKSDDLFKKEGTEDDGKEEKEEEGEGEEEDDDKEDDNVDKDVENGDIKPRKAGSSKAGKFDTIFNVHRIADEISSLREKQTAYTLSKINSSSNNSSNQQEPNELAEENQIGLGGAERLFTALLEIEKRRSHKEVPLLDFNNALNSVYKQHNINTFPPCYKINGTDIQKSLLLDIIPQEECELYSNYFFDYIHPNYYVFIESNYRKREELFFQILRDRGNYDKNLKIFNFSNEEICTFYLVWILGRKGYLLNLDNDNSDSTLMENHQGHSLVLDYTMKDYLNAINLCLSGCFFSSNLSTVRMLYLASLYHSSIKNRSSAWHLMANACVKCVGLGYHRNYNISKMSEMEQEEIKIIWWSCFKFHVMNCSILGRLPNISLYEVDLGLPKLDFIEDELYKSIHNESINLFKIMFSILKNREYLIKSRNPWCEQTFRNVLYIKEELLQWERNLTPESKKYKRANPRRYQIKLQMQYHHSVISLTVPYLIAYALKPKKSIESNKQVIKTLCDGIKSAIETAHVISYSSLQKNFNGFLFYDLFYAYNAIMVLLLGYTLIKSGSCNHQSKDYNIIADTLKIEFNVDIQVILNAVYEVKEINNKYGPSALGIVKDASNNITLLLKHFKMNDNKPPSPLLYNTQLNNHNVTTTNITNINSSNNYTNNNMKMDNTTNTSNNTCSNSNIPQLQSILNPMSNPINSVPYLLTGDESSNIDMFNENVDLDTDFFEIIDQMNVDSQVNSIGINDKYFLDWNKVFSTETLQ